jgi:thioredoxin-like negative regulator of GroEL
MPPRRRTAPQRRGASQPKSYVYSIGSVSQLNAALEKGRAKHKVVIVQFYQESSWACKQLRPIFRRYSGLPGFRAKALFVEVDMDNSRDVVREADVTKVPTYQCYYEGELVDSYEGTAPSAMRDFVDRNIKEYCSGQGPRLWQKVLVALAAVAGAGVAWVYSQGNQSKETLAQSAREEILSIKQRIVTAQGRLKNLEKANRGKQAKAQRKLIEQLNAQRRALERTQQMAEKKEEKVRGSADRAKSGSTASMESENIREKRRSSSRKYSYDELARIRHRKRMGEVLYSDEEEILYDGQIHPPEELNLRSD